MFFGRSPGHRLEPVGKVVAPFSTAQSFIALATTLATSGSKCVPCEIVFQCLIYFFWQSRPHNRIIKTMLPNNLVISFMTISLPLEIIAALASLGPVFCPASTPTDALVRKSFSGDSLAEIKIRCRGQSVHSTLLFTNEYYYVSGSLSRAFSARCSSRECLLFYRVLGPPRPLCMVVCAPLVYPCRLDKLLLGKASPINCKPMAALPIKPAGKGNGWQSGQINRHGVDIPDTS